MHRCANAACFDVVGCGAVPPRGLAEAAASPGPGWLRFCCPPGQSIRGAPCGRPPVDESVPLQCRARLDRPMRVNRIIADLQVADIEAAKGFYTDYLGLTTEEFN